MTTAPPPPPDDASSEPDEVPGPASTAGAAHDLATATAGETPGRAQTIFDRITGAQWKAGAFLGLVAFGAALAVSLVGTILLLAGAYSIPDLPDEGSAALRNWFPWVFQLVGMGFLSPVGGSLTADTGLMGSVELSASLFFAPLVVPAAAIAAVLTLGRRVTGGLALPRGATRVIVAAVAGIEAAAVMLLLTAVLPVTTSIDESTRISLRALSVWGFLFMALVVFAAAYVRIGPPGEYLLPLIWRQAGRQVVEHLGALSLVLGLALVITMAAALDEGSAAILLGVPLLLPLFGLNGMTVGSLSAVTGSGTVGSFLGDSSTNGTLTMFSAGLPAWIRVVLPIVLVLAVVVAGLRWRARRGPVTATATDWVALPVIYAAFGLLALAFGTVSLDVSGGGIGGFTGSAGPAPWAFLILAVLGLFVDLVARFAALPLLRALPAGLAVALIGRVGARRVDVADPRTHASVALRPESAPVTTPHAAPPATAEPGSATTDAHVTASANDVPVATGQPLSPRARRVWLVTGVGVLVVSALAVGGTLMHSFLARTQFGPQQQVETYLQALVDGDASTAVGLLDPNVNSGERILLADEVYSAAKGRPTAFEITDTSIDGETASVEATMTMDTKKHPVSFSLDKQGRQAVLFDGWSISEGPSQQVTLGDVSGVPAVNGVEVDLSAFASPDEADGYGLTALPALPGQYTFTAPEGTDYLTYGDDITVLLVPEAGLDEELVGSEVDPTIVHFEQGWTPQAGEDAIAAAKKHVAGCMTSDQFEPESCENTLDLMDWGYAVTGIKRSWESDPVYTFDDGTSEDGYSNDGPAVVITGGDLTIDYKSRYDEDDSWDEDSYSKPSVFGGDWSSTRIPVSISDDGKLDLDFSNM